jgi:hypothetical protein
MVSRGKTVWTEMRGASISGWRGFNNYALNNGEVDMIKKAEGGYKVLSEKGKNLGGPYKTKKEAEKRLQQVEYFKHKK